ncbi:MAG: sel1 repeat family protein [Gammaproteobacteria bacterium]|nr:sel1 repeat family protein [Gammaproteobacteria bacterium]
MITNLPGCSKTKDTLYSYFPSTAPDSNTSSKGRINNKPTTNRWKSDSLKLKNINAKTTTKKKDINWYKASAKSGNSSSQYILGNAYFKGKQYSTAMRYYEQAARNNHAKAQFKLALMYHLGKGTKDGEFSRKKSTKDWLKKAKSNGSIEAKKAWRQLKIDDYWCLGGLCY